MALKPCRECKLQVSTTAKICPHCGVRNPTSNPSRRAIVALLVILAIMIFGAINQTQTPKQAEVVEATCKNDFRKCLDNEDMVNNYSRVYEAKAACKTQLSDSVKFGEPEWSWGSFGSFFVGDDYPKTGVVRLIDDRVKIQNAFGAQQNSRVVCSYNFNEKKAVIVSIFPR
jgi:hypothetical protein